MQRGLIRCQRGIGSNLIGSNISDIGSHEAGSDATLDPIHVSEITSNKAGSETVGSDIGDTGSNEAGSDVGEIGSDEVDPASLWIQMKSDPTPPT